MIAVLLLTALPASAEDLPKPSDLLKSAGEAPSPEVKGAPADNPRVMARLKITPFKGATVDDTRANVERFLAPYGRRVLHYQDNETTRAIDVSAREASGAVASIQRALRMRSARKRLEGSPLVDNVRETPAGLTAVFKRWLYDEEFGPVVKGLPDGVSWDRYRNSAMSGVWVDLEARGAEDAKALAARLGSEHPKEIEGAEALYSVEVFRGSY